MLKVIYEEKVPVVTFVEEVHADIFKEFKKRGIKIVYRSLNPSPENAKAAEDAGADIIVATGFDEGGTLPNMVLGTFSIVPLIVDAVKHTPVMAADGIADNRAFNAALALGAEGVYCGIAFLMSKESRMAENVKQAILKSNARDLLLFHTIPAYYRSLPGILANELLRWTKLEQLMKNSVKKWWALQIFALECWKVIWIRDMFPSAMASVTYMR